MRGLRFILFFVIAIFSAVCFAQPANDICSSAISIQTYLEQATSETSVAGPYSNVAATGNDVDIATVTGCWLDDLTGLADGSSPQVDATVWFHFTGISGVFDLQVQPCDTNLNFISQDTQMALFTGECDSLLLVDCNEDMDAAAFNYWSGIQTTLEQDASYYLAVDGFNYSGFGSPELPLTTGEFCLRIANSVLSVSEKMTAHLQLFPNPTDGAATIQADEELLAVDVYDSRGALIASYQPQHLRRMELSLSESVGVYVVRVKTTTGAHCMRVVRN